MKLLFFLISISLATKTANAIELIDIKSPIEWTIWTQNDGKEVLHRGNDINSLLQKGLENKKLGIKCTFKLEKNFGEMKGLSGEKVKTYSERIWPECHMKDGLIITMDAWACESAKGFTNRFASSGLYFNLSTFNMRYMCSVNHEI